MEDPISMIALPTPNLVTEDSACGLSPEGPAASQVMVPRPILGFGYLPCHFCLFLALESVIL